MSDEPGWGPAREYHAKPRWRQGRGDLPTRDRGGRQERAPREPAPEPRRRPSRQEDGWYDEPGQRPAPRRRRRRGRGVGFFLVLVLLAVLAYPVALGIVGYRSVDRIGAIEGLNDPDTPGHTVLLVGSDSREGTEIGGGGGARTDTIMLLHRPAGGGPTVLLSIPRDSYVAIPGNAENKVNAAYAFGGPSLLAQTVEQATGIGIDSYVETDLARFPAMVDAVGGVELCPKEAINDPKAGNLDVPAGCQEMDGETALGYARTRVGPMGDLGRVERQREVIAAIASQGTQPATLLNPLRSFRLASSAGKTLSVDDGTGPMDLARFGLAMRAVAGGSAVTLTVPVADATRRTNAGLVVDWDTEKAEQVFNAIRTDDTEAIRPIAEEQQPG